jgi:hypothetical protein
MNNKITIIEGPTPEFRVINRPFAMDGSVNWAGTIFEGPFLYDTAFTNLRTFDSQKLLDRCLDAWSANQTMYLEYRDHLGMRREDPILAARALTIDEGDLLYLWVRREAAGDEQADPEDDDEVPF